jgi:hypothetical protein
MRFNRRPDANLTLVRVKSHYPFHAVREGIGAGWGTMS